VRTKSALWERRFGFFGTFPVLFYKHVAGHRRPRKQEPAAGRRGASVAAKARSLLASGRKRRVIAET